MRHTTSGTVSVLEYLTEYAKDSISLIETCFYINCRRCHFLESDVGVIF